MHDSRALQLAMLLRTKVYRGSPRVDEALNLLRENDYQTLLRTKAKHLRAPLTWATVSAVAVKATAAALLEGDLDRALDAADLAPAFFGETPLGEALPVVRPDDDGVAWPDPW